MSCKIETIAIGDEILTGRISDTNSTFVADALYEVGHILSQQTVVPDDSASMQQAFQASGARADVVIVFGGLGPTTDDKTVDEVSAALGCPAMEYPPARERMVQLYSERNRPLTSSSHRQVRYPEKAVPLPNNVGLAPGFRCSLFGADFFFLPGVPSEMKALFHESVLPWIQKEHGSTDYVTQIWRCLGIPESALQEQVKNIESNLPDDLWLGFRTRYPENHLTLYGRKTDGQAPKGFESFGNELREVLAPWVFTEDNRDLEEVVASQLSFLNKSLVLAESCTGGLASERLTRVSGSSQFLWGSFVSYQVDAKQGMLDVEVSSSEEAVSSKTSRRLAEQAKEKSGADVSAAITGYVGPTGGTEADPIGIVYLCVISDEVREERVDLGKRFGRAHLKWGASSYLLNLIRKSLV